MSRANLFLWMMLNLESILAGLAVALGVYYVIQPREAHECSGLTVEGWRIYALLAAVPAFAIGVELMLWLLIFDYRAPLAFTGLPGGLGTLLIALAPIPLFARHCTARAWRVPPRLLAVVLLAGGLGLLAVGRTARAAAWSDLSAKAMQSAKARDTLVTLKGYRYLTADEAHGTLDAALPDLDAVLDAAAHWRADETVVLDRSLDRYLLDRIEGALIDAPPAQPDAVAARAVPATWWLSRDPDTTFRIYALTQLEHHARGREARPLEPTEMQRLAVDALDIGDPELTADIAQALYRPTVRVPLESALIEALAARLDEPPPVGSAALLILLRDGSRRALRPILPRLADERGPDWELATDPANCPVRTSGLTALVDDPDPTVAAGAQAVLSHVRQNCSRARQVGE